MSEGYLDTLRRGRAAIEEAETMLAFSELKDKLKATELERDDFHRELMDLRYQIKLAKAA